MGIKDFLEVFNSLEDYLSRLRNTKEKMLLLSTYYNQCTAGTYSLMLSLKYCFPPLSLGLFIFTLSEPHLEGDKTCPESALKSTMLSKAEHLPFGGESLMHFSI